MMNLIIQNFELVMFIITMIIAAELILLAFIVFHKKRVRKKRHKTYNNYNANEAVKASKNKDEYGFVYFDLDEDDDLHFDFK